MFHQSESSERANAHWLLLCFWTCRDVWQNSHENSPNSISPPPPAKRNCWCFRVEGARSDFLLVRERDVPLRQIPCSLFEFVLGGLSHCEQPSVATHTIARVGWGLWGTAGWRAINIHGPGAHSLLYSSVKIQWRWHYFQRIKVGLFLLEMVCSYVTALT